MKARVSCVYNNTHFLYLICSTLESCLSCTYFKALSAVYHTLYFQNFLVKLCFGLFLLDLTQQWTFLCVLGNEHFTDRNKKFLESAPQDFFIDQFLLYGSKGRCLKHCKETNLSPKLRNPDPALLRDFHQYLPYSYLHYAYYQVSFKITLTTTNNK